MTKIVKIDDGADPGATPGKAFVASLDQLEIQKQEAFLSHLNLGVKGAVSTAAVAIETFAGLLSEFNFNVGPETRIQLNLTELVALMAFYYGELPFIWENTDNTGNDFIFGVKIPVNDAHDDKRPMTRAASWVTQTNIATSTLALTGSWLKTSNGKKPIHAVRIAHTSAGSAGYELLDFTMPKVGKMIGIIVKQANGFDDGNIDVSIQRVKIVVDGQTHSSINMAAHYQGIPGVFGGTELPLTDLLKGYHFIDLKEEGIDTKGQEVKLQIDVQDASDAVVIIPVIEME